MYLTPLTAPSTNMYIFVQVLEGLTSMQVLFTPLIQDYTAVDSRGKAFSLTMMGVSLGTITAMWGLVKYTEELDPKI